MTTDGKPDSAANEKVLTITDKCIGCGACVAIAGEAFDIGDDLLSHVRADAVLDSENIEAAIKHCPVGAIVWK